MSQTSSTPGRVQSCNSLQHQSMSEEIERLKKELTRAQADRELLREEWERERAERITLIIEIRKLRSSSHRTSSDQISIQQWQDRAEKAEERAETAERELIKFRDIKLPKFRDIMTRAIVEATGQVINDGDDRIFLPKNEGEIPSHSQQPPPRQPPSGEAISPSDRISRLSSELRRVRARENQFNAENHPRSLHETTSAVKERALKLGGPSNLPKYVSPRLLPRSSPLPEIPAASTTSAVRESSQTETQSFRGQWPGAEPAEAQPADRNREVNSLTIEMTGNSDQDEEQTPDTNITYVAASKRPKGIPAAVSRTRGKYWPRGRI